MKLDVISHCTIDTIEIDDSKYVVPGGPGCYCSLTARALKFDVKLHTKFGSDFTYTDYLTKQKIVFENAFSTEPTTRFILQLVNSERTLFLENKCEVINNVILDTDSVIISPLFDEVPLELFEKIKNDANFVLLDPQGFLRRVNSENKIYLEQTNLNLSGISAIKVNSDELRSLTNSSNLDGIKILQKKGISNVILTDKQNISLLSEDKIYSIRRHKKFHFWMKTGVMKLSTIHSFKGWEAPTLFLVLDETDGFTSPELVYAGLTRCRFRLIIINRHNNDLN